MHGVRYEQLTRSPVGIWRAAIQGPSVNRLVVSSLENLCHWSISRVDLKDKVLSEY